MELSYVYIGCITATIAALFRFLPFQRSILELMWFSERKVSSGFSKRSTAEEVTQGIDGNGLTAIVTGGASGVGSETARVLALRGVHVVIADINTDGGRKVKKAILEENPNAKIDVMEIDLGSFASVRNFASEFKSLGLPLNLLINNAGLFAPPMMLTPDKIDLQFQVNHLGHFLLTNLLLETMKSTARQSHREGRIVIVASAGHKLAFHGIQLDGINDNSWYNRIYGYFQSKLANVLFAKELAKRLKEEGEDIIVNSVHPGIIDTNISRYLKVPQDDTVNINATQPITTNRAAFCYVPQEGSSMEKFRKYVTRTIPQGAATTCYVAMHPQVKGVSGEYFSDCNIAKSSSLAKDTMLAKKIWDLSLSMTEAK